LDGPDQGRQHPRSDPWGCRWQQCHPYEHRQQRPGGRSVTVS